MTLNLSMLLPGGFTAAQTTAASAGTLVTGPSSPATTVTSGAARLRVGPGTLATITP